MPAKLLVLPEANGDLIRAVDWYESQCPGLGDKFFSMVKKRFDSILFNPDQFEPLFAISAG